MSRWGLRWGDRWGGSWGSIGPAPVAPEPIGSLTVLSGTFGNDVSVSGAVKGAAILSGKFQTVITLNGNTLD